MATLASTTGISMVAFRFAAETEPRLPAEIVVGRVHAILDLLVLGCAALDTLDDSDITGRRPDYLHWGGVGSHRARTIREGIRVQSISYSNPLEQVLLALLSKPRASGVAGFLQFFLTIGQERAERRERIQQSQIKTALQDATLEFAVDKATAKAVFQELEMEAKHAQNRRDEVLFALEIIAAQRRVAEVNPTVKVWELRDALNYIKGEPALIEGARDLQTLELSIEIIEPGIDGQARTNGRRG
ncbi:hypothetical protein ACVXZ4_04145 [Lacisediminihabitans sp. FW035]